MGNQRDVFVEKAVELGDYLYLVLSSEISEDCLERFFNLTYEAKIGDKTVLVNDNNYRIERKDKDFHEYDPLNESFEEISYLFIDCGYDVFEISSRCRDNRTGLVTKIQANVRPCQD